MLWTFPLTVQTWDRSYWTTTVFNTSKEFIEYLWGQFKLPGKYNLDIETSRKIQEEGLHYTKTAKLPNFQGGYYHSFVKGTANYKKWHETQKDRILNGVIYNGIYVPPFYYWYINFCPIYDAKLGKTKFGDVWDTDIWYFQYIMIAMMLGKHVGGVKGRQKGFSFKHMALLYWRYCWFEKSVNTIGAYQEDLVAKSWRFLDTYRNHINKYTPWKRGPIKGKNLEWNERIERKDGTYAGLESKLAGITFKQSTSKDVGGSQSFFNYEEPGVAPTILETLEFIRPAVERGSITTGTIVACGSVGNLEEAEGLKEIFYKPNDYNFLAVKNIWDEDAGEDDVCCIFISEAYSLIGDDIDKDDQGRIIGGTGKPFIDEAGNSNVELALAWIERNNERIKNSKKKADLKQISISQKCTSPKQAFAERKINFFPVSQLRRRQEQITILDAESKWDRKPQKGLLYMDAVGEILLDTRDGGPEHKYPIKPEWEDKRGLVTIYKWPEKNPKKFTYFAGVDTVEADETDSSVSIQTVDIFEGSTTVKDENGKILRIEGDKLVATYRGRFNPVDKGNEQAWFLIKLYNAYCYQERSKPNFQSFMKRNGLAETYLAKENEVQLFKDVNFYKVKESSQYGFVITDNNEVWKTFKKMIKEYLFTEYDRVSHTTDTGEEIVFKTYTGIDRIDDYWLLEEMIQYAEDSSGRPKKNTDRLISFAAALTISKVFQNNTNSVRVETSDKQKPKQQYYTKPVNLLGGTQKKTYNNTKGGRKGPISMI